MKRRKHRLELDVTFSHAITRRMAAKGVQLVLDWRVDLGERPVWASKPAVYLEKVRAIEPRRRR